jgi:hypothetical protein
MCNQFSLPPRSPWNNSPEVVTTCIHFLSYPLLGSHIFATQSLNKALTNSLNSPLNSNLNSLTFKLKANSFNPVLNPQFHTTLLPMFTKMLTKRTFPLFTRGPLLSFHNSPLFIIHSINISPHSLIPLPLLTSPSSISLPP